MKVRINKTKIIATFGPACNDKAIMEEMVSAGVDVFRFNMSHGTYDDHLDGINKIREINHCHPGRPSGTQNPHRSGA
jgi:pyruvate kinase